MMTASRVRNAWKTFFLYAGVGTGGTEGQWLGHDHIGNARSTPGLLSKHHEGIGSKLVTSRSRMARIDVHETCTSGCRYDGPGA